MILGLIVIGIGVFFGLNELGRELAKGRVEAARIEARQKLLLGGRSDLLPLL